MNVAKNVRVKIKGIEEVVKVINHKKLNIEKTKSIVRTHAGQLQANTRKAMEQKYTGHYEGNKFVMPTGATRKSVAVEISNGGKTATIGSTTEYFSYLEYGTRFMSARPTLKPAFDKQAPLFKADIEKLIEK